MIYAGLLNQKKFKFQKVYSAKLDIQDKDSQVLDETELFFRLNLNQNLRQSDIHEIDFKSSLEHQRHQHYLKDSG